MGENSTIGWTDHTFNPWIGCAHVSPGCENCYAEDLADFRKSWGVEWGPKGTRKMMAEEYWRKPIAWDRAAWRENRRARVFCASLADVFEDRPDLVAPRARLFRLIAATPSLDWLLLTKRPENVVRLLDAEAIGAFGIRRIWLGATAENQKFFDLRWPVLAKAASYLGAAVDFVSYEPALGPLELRCAICGEGTRMHLKDPELRACPGWFPRWVICGGESGGPTEARAFEIAWMRSARDQCAELGIPFFAKQLGTYPLADRASDFNGRRTKPYERGLQQRIALRLLDGKHGADEQEWPEDLRGLRAWPAA
ncbi:MAG TPA: DUF5131 family protein [Thermoanaerobaculia bacterium]|nr:DUF5131 family protein [Thermoanaerobaculia bacterium]